MGPRSIKHNSKRVRLFIATFKQVSAAYDTDALNELELDLIRQEKRDDYSIPDSLPPSTIRKPKRSLFMTTISIGPVIAGLFTTMGTVKFGYVIGFYEMVAGLVIYGCYKFAISRSCYRDFDTVVKTINPTVVGFMVVHHVSLAAWFLGPSALNPLVFFEFMMLRIQTGLTLKELNLGWIGLVISWVLQFALPTMILKLDISRLLLSSAVKSIPPEVLEFAEYHFLKGKSEAGVKRELANMGWTDKHAQDAVFDAIESDWVIHELRKSD